MSEAVQEYAAQAEMDAVHVLEHPDPDPDLLPALRPEFELQEQTAGHLVRAVLKAEVSVGALETKRDADLLAWNQMIQAHKNRLASWRACIRDWMLRHGVTKLQHPLFTASIGKGRTRIVVEDEEKAIAICRSMGAIAAVKIVERVDKKEFDVIFNSRPTLFEGVAHEETGEPVLLIRRREQ